MTRPDPLTSSDQEIFDYVVSALIKQGKPARDAFYCQYETLNGLRCSVGHLIDNPKGLKGTVNNAKVQRALYRGRTPPLRRNAFLQHLQIAHDDRSFNWLPDFKERARQIALRFNLNTKVLDADPA